MDDIIGIMALAVIGFLAGGVIGIGMGYGFHPACLVGAAVTVGGLVCAYSLLGED